MEAGDWLRPPLEVNSPEGKIKDSGLALSFYIYCKVLVFFFVFVVLNLLSVQQN